MRVFALIGLLVPMAAMPMQTAKPVDNAGSEPKAKWYMPSANTKCVLTHALLVPAVVLVGALGLHRAINYTLPSHLSRPPLNLTDISPWKMLGWSIVGACIGELKNERRERRERWLQRVLKADNVSAYNKATLVDINGARKHHAADLTAAAQAGAVKIFDRLVEVGMKPTKADYAALDKALVADLKAKEELANLHVKSPLVVNPAGDVSISFGV